MGDRSNTNTLGEYKALIAAGTVAIVALVVLMVVIVATDDDDEPGRKQPATQRAALPPRTLQAKTIGVQIRRPRGWRARRTARGITLRSPDRYILMAISLPPGRKRNTLVLRENVAAIRRQYARVRVGRPSGRRVANLPTVSVVTSATNDRGVRLSILSAAAQGRRRAWLLQVFAADKAPNNRLAEAQNALGTLRLRE